MILASNDLLSGATTEIMVHPTVVLLGPASAAERTTSGPGVDFGGGPRGDRSDVRDDWVAAVTESKD
jgi:hypothetical protein